jgi:hypothetical protein
VTDRTAVAAQMLGAMLGNSDILEMAAEQAGQKGLRLEQVLAARAIAQADTLLAILAPIVTNLGVAP